jgi:hypothetical protein
LAVGWVAPAASVEKGPRRQAAMVGRTMAKAPPQRGTPIPAAEDDASLK